MHGCVVVEILTQIRRRLHLSVPPLTLSVKSADTIRSKKLT